MRGGILLRTIEATAITDAVKKLCVQVSYDLPKDVEKALNQALATEESSFGQYSLEQIINNCHLARQNEQAMCQDTGIAVIYLYLGQDVHIVGGALAEAVHEGVREGYEAGYLRKSVVIDPVFSRENTGDNTPAVIHTEIVPGDTLRIVMMPKGAGSENMGALKMLKPTAGVEGVKEFIIDTVRKAGGNPCPPIIVGVGVGGTMEKATMLAKEALQRPTGQSNPNHFYAQLEKELLHDINKLGIGPQGLGGRVTALAVHIEHYPTHIATLPVAVNLNCHAARHGEIIL